MDRELSIPSDFEENLQMSPLTKAGEERHREISAGIERAQLLHHQNRKDRKAKAIEMSKGPSSVRKTVKADTTRYQAVPGARSAVVRNTDQRRNTPTQTLPTHPAQPLPGQTLPMQAPLRWEPPKLLSATHALLFRSLPTPGTPLQWAEPELQSSTLSPPMQAPSQASPAQVQPTEASTSKRTSPASKRKADGGTRHKETRDKKQKIGFV
ncbi:MAG: hypothetical protein Q9205_003169 [Flavoplaca limonia]